MKFLEHFKTLPALVLGAVTLGILTGCDLVEEKTDNFGELTEQVQDQIAHDVFGEQTDEEIMAAQPVAERALSGRREASPELAAITLEEALRTQSYYSVGSIIAKPRESITTIVAPTEVADSVETEFDAIEAYYALEAEGEVAAADAEPVEEPSVSQGNTGEAESQPEIKTRSAKRRLEEMRKTRPDFPADMARKGERLKAMKRPRFSKIDETMANRLPRRSDLPGVEQYRQLDALPPEAIEAIEAVRSTHGPRVRKIIKADAAAEAQTRMRNRLERLGLPGAIDTRDGGELVINVNLDPTKYPANGARHLENAGSAIRARFASKDAMQHADMDEAECESNAGRARIQRDATYATQCVVEVLKESDLYEYVEEDFIFSHQFERRPASGSPNAPPASTLSRIRPNDPLWSLQWHFMDLGDGEDKSAGGAGFADFWNRTRQTGSAGVTVAVVDTGLQADHPDINGSANLAPGFDMVSDPFMGNDGDGRDTDPTDPGDACDPEDPLARDSYHGTHVAGTVGVAATNNSSGVAGGAWNVTIVPVRALGRCGGQLSDINDGIRWAAGVVAARDDFGGEIWNSNPADIINLSIGLFERCPASLQEAINDATAAGSIVVAAAGNARIDTKYYAPGGCANVITVAAGDARGHLAYYSNYGDGVDVLAPGGDMTRDDDEDGRPDGILSTKLSSDCYDPLTGETVANCQYAYENGTSMAAPHVSAALALLKSQFPTATSDELRARLLAATSPRDKLACSGKCSHYPGAEPIEGEEGLCYRPCGGAMLNMANASLE